MRTERLSQPFQAFRKDGEGVALVEFAILLPVLLVAYCGSVDICSMVTASRKVTQLTSALADLTARASSVTPTDVSNIFDAAQMVLSPYDASKAKMTISNIVIDDKGVARVCWSSQRNSVALARGAAVTLPTNVKVPNTSVIMATASYEFTPIAGYVVTGNVTLGNNPIYTRPRGAQPGGDLNIEQITLSTAKPCPSFS